MANVQSRITNQHKNVDVEASGDNTVIPAVAGQVIEVHSLALTFASQVDVTIKDGSTVLGVYIGVTALVLDEMPSGRYRFLGDIGNAFVINLSSATACKGTVWFSQR